MTTKRYPTNLKCAKCVAAVTAGLDSQSAIQAWEVDTNAPEKWLTIEGDLPAPEVDKILQRAGFSIVDAAAQAATSPRWKTYYPLLLIVGYLLLVTVLCELVLSPPQLMRGMRHFMGGFFLAFSFFKLLDLRGFGKSFEGYDLVAKAWPPYGLAYPFIELALGVCYVLNLLPMATNVVTAVVMFVGIIGVSQVLLQKKTIQCACLGTGFNLPMSYVTFIENGLMIVMACVMLWLHR